jgi:hypothetical protein
MTSVFSGGLVYEYSMERVPGGPNAASRMEFGLVEIKGDTVTELDDFQKVKKGFEKPLPEGDGGYKASGKPTVCPSNSTTWYPIPPPAVQAGAKISSIPLMPQDAENYMKNGAGVGPGFKGKGSHDDTREGGAKSQGWYTPPDTASSGSSTTSGDSQTKQDTKAKNGGKALASNSIVMLLFGTVFLPAIGLLF